MLSSNLEFAVIGARQVGVLPYTGCSRNIGTVLNFNKTFYEGVYQSQIPRLSQLLAASANCLLSQTTVGSLRQLLAVSANCWQSQPTVCSLSQLFAVSAKCCSLTKTPFVTDPIVPMLQS